MNSTSKPLVLFKIPRKIKVLGITWKIKIVDKLPGMLGSCNNTTREIILLKTKDWKRLEDCFYHELNHALLYSTTGGTHNTEDIVVPMSIGLKDVVKQMIKIQCDEPKDKKSKLYSVSSSIFLPISAPKNEPTLE